MVTEKMYEKLAQLVVRKGVNVQKDQPLIIRAHVQDAAFVKKVAKYAYEAGARYVSVEWHDSDLTRMAYQYESKEVLSHVPQWKYDRTRAQHDDGACYITILSDKPGVMAGVDRQHGLLHQDGGPDGLHHEQRGPVVGDRRPFPGMGQNSVPRSA